MNIEIIEPEKDQVFDLCSNATGQDYMIFVNDGDTDKARNIAFESLLHYENGDYYYGSFTTLLDDEFEKAGIDAFIYER